MNNIKILVCCHKKSFYAKDYPYLPIQVGKSISNLDLGIQGDNEGPNISQKNKTYCELTAIYWAWKNLKSAEYIGLCHYRRYFDFHHQCKKGFRPTCFPEKEGIEKLDLNIPLKEIGSLGDSKIILSRPESCSTNLFMQYCTYHFSDDLRILGSVIKEFSPNIYSAFKTVMYHQNMLSPYNMFIMSRVNFDEYCNWLFFILAELEKRVHIEYYSDFNKRIFGFMGERLLNVWIKWKGIKPIYRPIIMLSDSKNDNIIVSYLKYIKHKLGFIFTMSENDM
jgi:hypothetical protein